jgi:hypothetical protein
MAQTGYPVARTGEGRGAGIAQACVDSARLFAGTAGRMTRDNFTNNLDIFLGGLAVGFVAGFVAAGFLCRSVL